MMRYASTVCLLMSIPAASPAQTVQIRTGPAVLYAPARFADEYGVGYSATAGIGVKLSKRFDLQLVGEHAFFPLAVDGYERHEVRSYHPFVSELVHYQVHGGNVRLQALRVHVRFTLLPKARVRPYLSIGAGLSRRIRDERTTTPPGSVFERDREVYGAIAAAADVGCSLALSRRLRLAAEVTLTSSTELFVTRKFVAFGLGLEYEL